MKGGKDIKDIIIVDGKMVDRRTFLKIAGTAAGSMLLAGSFPGMLEATPGKGEYLFEKVTMCRGGEPQTMDATISVDRVALIMYLHIYDRLVTRDRNTMKLIPQMATGWEIVDNRHWRFKLKKGIKFHDGTEFDADSVKFTMDRIMDPKVASPGAASYRGLKETAVIDKYTVEFRFDKFFPIMTAQLYIVFWPVSRAYYQGKSQDYLATHPMGTGMYKFVEWVRGDKIVLEANENYWGEPKPPSKYLIWRFIPEVATKVAALKTGELDIAANIPPEEIPALEKNPDTKITTSPTSRVMFAYLRTDRDSPLRNKKVRQAFNYAVDKEELCKSIAMGYEKPLQGQPVTDMHFGFNPNVKMYPYNPDKAKKLLSEAGYPNGFKLKMGGPIGRFLKDQEMGTAVVGYLREIGIDVDYRPEPWSIYYPKWKRKDPPWDMVYHGWGGYSTFDPEGTLPYLIETGGPQSRYSNKEVDALIKQGREESHVKKREKIYHKMMEILHDDPPWIYLTTHVDIHGYRSRLTFSARPDELMSARDIGKP